MTPNEAWAIKEANRQYEEIVLEGDVHLTRLFDALIAATKKGAETESRRLSWFIAEEGRTWSQRGEMCAGKRFVLWNADRSQSAEGDSLIEAIDAAIENERMPAIDSAQESGTVTVCHTYTSPDTPGYDPRTDDMGNQRQRYGRGV